MNTCLRLDSRYKSGVIHLNVSSIIEFELVFVLFERLFIQLGMPSAIIYILDIINLFLFFVLIQKHSWKHFVGLVMSYVIMIVLSTLIAFVNYTEWNGNPIFTLIELRNITRFLVFFLACVVFLNDESCKRIYKVLTIFFFVNMVFITYQYFTYHPVGVWTRGDYLNGLFGITVGGNTFVNVIFLVVVTYLLARWSNGEVSSKLFILAVLISLIISGLIELKAFFLEFLILYVWYLIKKKKSRKEKNINIAVIMLMLIVVYITLQIMYREYPWFREIMTLSGMIESLTGSGYTGSGDLNRFTGVFTIASNFFNGSIVDSLFGIGVGNCSAFTVGENVTKFYLLYHNSHYNWFSATYTFIQGGAVGLILYLYTFVNLLMKKKRNDQFKLNSQIICIMALFLVFYGEALKTDAGYFVYFAIASGFVQEKSTKV